jgi:hypothetical protein
MSWETVHRLRLVVVLSLLVMVTTGSTALAQTGHLEGVSEERIFITLPIYISSILTVGCACYLLGRWTKGRESEIGSLRAEVESLRKSIQDRPHEHGQIPVNTP